MRDRLMKVETIVGDDADSGLRGDMKIMFERLRQIETRMYLAVGGGTVVLFILDKVWK